VPHSIRSVRSLLSAAHEMFTFSCKRCALVRTEKFWVKGKFVLVPKRGLVLTVTLKLRGF
jgi:hypothetical protein